MVLDNTGTLTIDEGGTGTFTVKLDKKPTAAVTVNISSFDTDIASPTPASASLIFTSTNYSTAQTVTITGVQDSDNDDEQVTLTITATGGISAPSLTKTVSVDDDEGPSAIVLDSTNILSIDEGNSGTFTVKISPPSTPSVVVSLASSDSNITVVPSSLTFAAGATAAQTVTVSAAHDADKNDETATITASTASIPAANVVKRIAVEDDDIPSGNIVLSGTARLSIDEGSNDTFTISLDTEPGDDVTVSITSADTGAVTVAPASLTFTSDNYATTQTVTVTGVQDADNDNEQEVTLTIAATGGIVASSVTKIIDVNDSESASSIVLSSTDTLTIEEGDTGVFGVRIYPASTVGVVVNLTLSNSNITISPTLLTFAANATATQEVTVSAAHDLDNIDGSATITLGTNSISTLDVVKQIAIQDDEPPTGNLVLSTARLSIDEGTGTAFTIGLDTKPIGDVTVSLSNPDTGAVTVSPASLTFNVANYSIARTVSIDAPHDSDIDDESITLTIETSGGVLAGNVTMDIDVADDDEAGSLVMAPSLLQVAEGGQETFLVRLGAVPNVDEVIVNLTNTNPAVTLEPTTLAFTPLDWNIGRDVTLSVEWDENDDNGVDTITGTFDNAGGNYAAAAAGSRGATIGVITLDYPGVIVTSAQTVRLVEGKEPFEFTVRLGEAPINTDTVTVTLSNTDPLITVSPSVLLFSRNNWGEEQSVTLQADEDNNKEDGYDFITLSGSGGNYNRATTTMTVFVLESGGGGIIGGALSPSGVYALAI
ncbi:beta strand repeat-containing protein, partial [Thioalkalivibrio sp. HK1]|uniref:beta strand repeat-containing protein n=1 Tax=Thioalkalivibrio sp. HK1 TaxID=1469245 RepID=UPI0004708C7B